MKHTGEKKRFFVFFLLRSWLWASAEEFTLGHGKSEACVEYPGEDA